MSVSDKPSDVNFSQWEAICHEGSHLLIVAGPGTGKTHTLTHRIVHFLNRLKNSQRILAITFTHKAAQEMRERLRVRSFQKEDSVDVETFHGFCLNFLREHLHRTDFQSGFNIASPPEVEMIAQRLWPHKTSSQRQKILE